MQTIYLDITSGTVPAVVHASQCDVGREIQFVLHENGETFEIPSDAVVSVVGTKSDGHPFVYANLPFEGSTVTVTTTYQMTAAEGNADCEIRIRTSNYAIYTANFTLDVEPMAMVGDEDLSEMDAPILLQAIEAGDKVDALSDKLAEGEKLIEQINSDVATSSANATNAINSATAAAKSEANAKTSETNASTSELNASASAKAASSSAEEANSAATSAASEASSAETSANSASDSAKLSESWAVGGTSTRTGEDSDNAKYYAEQAANSIGLTYSKTVTIEATGWSDKNDDGYYTYTISGLTIYADIPEIFMSIDDTTTNNQKYDYTKIAYAETSDNSITLYSSYAITRSITIIIKGVE